MRPAEQPIIFGDNDYENDKTEWCGFEVSEIGVNPLIWYTLSRDLQAATPVDVEVMRTARNQHWAMVPWVSANMGGKVPVTWHREPVTNRLAVNMQSSFVDLTNLNKSMRTAVTSPVAGWWVAEVDWSCCHWQIIAVESQDEAMQADIADPAHPLRSGRKVPWLAALYGAAGTPEREQLDALMADRWRAAGAWCEAQRLTIGDDVPSHARLAHALMPLEASYLDRALDLIASMGMASNLLIPHRDAIVIHGPPDDLPALAEGVAEAMRAVMTDPERGYIGMAAVKGIAPNWGFAAGNKTPYPDQLIGDALDRHALQDLQGLQTLLNNWSKTSKATIEQYLLPMSCYHDETTREMSRFDRRSVAGKAHAVLISQRAEAMDWQKKQLYGGQPPIADIAKYALTDAGTAQLLQDVHGKHLLPSKNKKDEWYVYQPTQGVWSFVHSGMGLAPLLSDVAAKAITSLAWCLSPEFRERAEGYYRDIGNNGKTARVSEYAWKVAAGEHGRAVDATAFDRCPSLICCANGTVDLRTGQVRPSTPEDRHSVRIPLVYDPSAPCPNWESVITRTMGLDPDETKSLTSLLGYLVTGETKEQKLIIFNGQGGNGKGVILNTLSEILGTYVSPVSTGVLSDALAKSATQPELANSWSARMLYISEWKDGAKLNDDTVKAITGGDSITVRGLYQSPSTAVPLYKPIISCQWLPETNSMDGGLIRRIVVVPFDVDMINLYPDMHIRDKLRAEHQGIFAWLVNAAMTYYRDGLQLARKWLAITEALRRDSDPFTEFLHEHYEMVAGWVTPFEHIWSTYQLAKATSFELTEMTSNAMGRKLRATKGITRHPDQHARRYIGLKPRIINAAPNVALDPEATTGQGFDN